MADKQLDKAALILQAISQATDAADSHIGNVQASSNWLILIAAASSEAHRLITGFPLHLEDEAITPDLSKGAS